MIKNKLSRIMGEKRINMTELHKISKLSRGAIFNLYHDKTSNISFDTLDKLCKALECNIQDIIEFIDE